MNAAQLSERVNFLLSSLHTDAHLSDDQIAEACTHAQDITGVTLPATDATKIRALVNRAHSFALTCVRNDWATKYDFASGSSAQSKLGGESLLRAKVFDHFDSAIARLDNTFDSVISPQLAVLTRSTEIRTAYRP